MAGNLTVAILLATVAGAMSTAGECRLDVSLTGGFDLGVWSWAVRSSGPDGTTTRAVEDGQAHFDAQVCGVSRIDVGPLVALNGRPEIVPLGSVSVALRTDTFVAIPVPPVAVTNVSIRDQSGVGLPACLVMARSLGDPTASPPGFLVTTGADGTARLPLVLGATYEIRRLCHGERRTVEVRVDGSVAADPPVLTQFSAHHSIDWRVDGIEIVRGQIRDDAGRPVQGVALARRSHGGVCMPCGVSGEDGLFSVAVDGFPVTISPVDRNGRLEFVPASIEVAGPGDDVVFDAVAARDLFRGVLVATAGAAVPNARIAASHDDGTLVVVESDENGAFEFKGAPGSSLRLTITPPHGSDATETVWKGRARYDKKPVVITCDRGLVVRGTVTDTEGRPVHDRGLRLVGRLGRRFETTIVDGEFEFRGVVPGNYRLSVGPNSAPNGSNLIALGSRDPRLDPADLAIFDDEPGMELEVVRGGEICVDVAHPDLPNTRFDVSFYPSGGPEPSDTIARIATAGTETVCSRTLRAGDYDVKFEISGDEFRSSWYPGVTERDRAAVVSLTNHRVTLPEMSLVAIGRVTLVVPAYDAEDDGGDPARFIFEYAANDTGVAETIASLRFDASSKRLELGPVKVLAGHVEGRLVDTATGEAWLLDEPVLIAAGEERTVVLRRARP